MIQSKFDDRRAAIRAKRILTIYHRRAAGGGSSSWHLSTTEDMSTLGLAFTTEEGYTAGDILELRVVMSGVLDIFNGYARVVRSEKKWEDCYKVAVKFSDLKAVKSKRSAKTYISGSAKRPARKTAKRK